jgi:hypothetical protein
VLLLCSVHHSSHHLEENRQLKSEIETMKSSSAELEETHSCQMTEALENLHTLSERHKAELAATKHDAQLKCKNCFCSLMAGSQQLNLDILLNFNILNLVGCALFYNGL